MQKREAVEIGVRACAPAGKIPRLGVDHRQVVQEPQRALIFARQRVVAISEEIRREAELPGKAGQNLHAERPVGALEGEHRRLEARQFVSARPELCHVRQRDLVGLLLVGRAGGRPHLALVFPARIGPLAERILRLDPVRQRKEALGHRESFVDLLLRDAVIDHLEETDFGRRLPKLVGDRRLARIEVAQIDARNVAGLGRADAAEGTLFVELIERVGCGAVRRHERVSVETGVRQAPNPAGTARGVAASAAMSFAEVGQGRKACREKRVNAGLRNE